MTPSLAQGAPSSTARRPRATLTEQGGCAAALGRKKRSANLGPCHSTRRLEQPRRGKAKWRDW
eukprot:9086773-Alexandrium_andersonii.AAC.1